MPAVLCERVGAVLVVTLNRPHALNAIDAAMHDGLADAWRQACEPAVRAVVVTGAGRGFCAGADISSPPEVGSGPPMDLRNTFNPEMLGMSALLKPVLAAVNGPAAGAGLGLALGADLRIAATTATFVPAFVRAGVTPDYGTTYFAVRLLGYSRAFEWLGSGRAISAEEALGYGMVEQVVEPALLVETVISCAERFTVQPGRVVGLTKLLLGEAHRRSLAEQLEAEHETQVAALADPARAAARAAVVDRLGADRDATVSAPSSSDAGPDPDPDAPDQE